MEINEIMYNIRVAPLFRMGTLWGGPQTKPSERMEEDKGEKERCSRGAEDSQHVIKVRVTYVGDY